MGAKNNEHRKDIREEIEKGERKSESNGKKEKGS